ncbi:acyl-CoA dehydrogenase family protein [Mycobacterium sp. 48b]|uniref:acyl-CoA dehydrogenase family protein n=1 Tax=Mycobacterium sp. 48b TaxID=3400426 RepID=UPI003AABAB93
MDRFELRREDYGLPDEQRELQAAYQDFFKKSCSIEAVWAAEASGHDAALWERLCAMGATTMALPESDGGDGATLIDLVVLAEEVGRSLAPVPWIDHIVAARLLSRLGILRNGGEFAEGVVAGTQILAFDPRLGTRAGRRLVPTAGAAQHVIVPQGEHLIRLTLDEPLPNVPNLARLPMAWVDPERHQNKVVLASGLDATVAHRRALDEWRLLTAAALTGVVDETTRVAAEFAKSRFTMGVSIGALQGISHPLANNAIVVESGRNLARRAAWYLEHEPDTRPELAGAAFVYLADEAPRAATIAVHAQGGLGVSTEAASTAYLVRARGWALAAGDPADTAKYIGRLVAARESIEGDAGVAEPRQKVEA